MKKKYPIGLWAEVLASALKLPRHYEGLANPGVENPLKYFSSL